MLGLDLKIVVLQSSVVPRLLCYNTQLVVIGKCNLSKSKFTGIFLNCIKEKRFRYKGFRHRIRDSYSPTEQAKSYWTFGLIFL